MTNNALNLLSIYNTDSDSEDEVPGPRVSVKRCMKDEDEYKNTKRKNRLPVPDIFQPVMKNDYDNSELHDGKIRSFPHERGNWSTYVFIQYELNDIMNDLISEIITKCNTHIILQRSKELHISLTKTVILRHHWIESFIKTISENISHFKGFLILFDKLKVYANEEKTRTFIGLQIKSGHESLISIVNSLDSALKEFNLPTFYENPSFHMSLVWCVGNYEDLLNSFLIELNKIVDDFMNNHPQFYWFINVNNLMCKTGNKMFSFKLC